MSKIKFEVGKEKYRILTVGILLSICLFLIYYFHMVLRTKVVFSHFFYVPIILASFWWKKKGTFVGVFLALLLILSHILSTGLSTMEFLSDLVRAFMLIVISATVAIISQRLSVAEDALKDYSLKLEGMVDKRTKEIEKEKNYTRHLIESSPDFQMTLDRDGNIMDLNEAFEEIVGKSRRDLIGTSIYKYLPTDETKRAIAKIFDKKKVRDIEISTKMLGKKDLIFNLSGTVFITQKGELGIYVTGRNITETKRQQENLLVKERQIAHTARLSTLGEMATAMAHEINQPLTVISMAAEGISRDIEKDRINMSLLPQDTEDILRNVKRIDDIIVHMRTFARQTGEWKVVQPDKILNDAFIIVGEQFRVHSISVLRHTKKNLPPIKVDPNQLEQVFINILTNARQVLDEKEKKTEQSGKSFKKKLICKIFQEDDYVVFEFADNGYGVPDDIKSKIFEPFFTTKEPGQGTGLGLSIVYGIVTQSLNGRIWVEDNKMGGASFKVAVPIIKNSKATELDTKAKEGENENTYCR
ncbi:MAG: PAS domain S-box protein [Nanoarchaeota archaeon]|nr:PAS domain S-box protein [Nanoarchaeota archaeon]